MDFLARGIMLIGIFLLIGALLPIGILMSQLRRSETRIKWAVLASIILFAIIGYFVYTYNSPHLTDIFSVIVPLVFFLGASFVWLITMSSLQAVNDVRHMAQLEAENITDPVMGIYNRRYLDRRLIEEIARARRYKLPLSVFMIDIDHFKSVNDLYGHKCGDVILKNLGKLVLDASRSSDVITRYGGEEICFIATNTNAKDAKNTAERLCRLIDSSTLITPEECGKPDIPHITVSIGVCTLDVGNVGTIDIVELADKAMYQAKNAGRNCVVVASVDSMNDLITN